MAAMAGLNKNSSAVKRIMSEARELQQDDSTEYTAGPLEEDIFEWHCTIRGPADTEFEGGLYHCRISLPPEYPFKAPSIMVLTPNGRFELNKKICISFTSYHEELWQPAWGVRTAIVGLQGFFPLKGEAAVGVGAIENPIAERKRLAQLSRSWVCPDCGVPNVELLPDPPARTDSTQFVLGERPKERTLTAPTTSIPTIKIEFVPDTVPPNMAAQPAGLSESGPTTTTSIPATLPPVVQPSTPRVQVDVVGRSRARPPLWLDALIAFFAVVVACMMGKRLGTLWDFVTEEFGAA